ncbi:MAG: 6-carboxytetrahydropterin synthase QueD [Candidatus Omnitrophica bacterium]|nr:6-carboxytetrahydropterin synthase QueD [Candidatus Omnitrophota bacterium]
MFELSVKSHIASAHSLTGYQGRCKNLHGHTWHIEAVIAGDDLDSIGMVADFALIKKQLNEFLMPLDHVCLNDLEYFKRNNPTTENIARYVYQNFAKVIAPLQIKRVQVWESETSSVVYFE